MIIIPIGVDCGIADFLKKYNLRSVSLPFDWAVSYNGVSKCIEDDFKYFTEPLTNRINIYDIYFHHDFQEDASVQGGDASVQGHEEDKQKYSRRCKRILNILIDSEANNEEVIFCRKGHSIHHHYEHNQKYFDIANDIEDAEKLDIILSNKYPNLNYKIIVILVCGHCFDANTTYTSTSDKIEIYNIAGPNADFENTARAIFKV